MKLQELDENRVYRKTAIPDGGQQVIFRTGVHLFGHFGNTPGMADELPVVAEALAFPLERLQPFSDIFFPVLFFEPVADFRTAFGTADDFQPVQTGPACF